MQFPFFFPIAICLSPLLYDCACLTLSIYSRPPTSALYLPWPCPASALWPRAPFPYFPLRAAPEALIACPVPSGRLPRLRLSPTGSGSWTWATASHHSLQFITGPSQQSQALHLLSFNRRQSDLHCQSTPTSASFYLFSGWPTPQFQFPLRRPPLPHIAASSILYLSQHCRFILFFTAKLMHGYFISLSFFF